MFSRRNRQQWNKHHNEEDPSADFQCDLQNKNTKFTRDIFTGPFPDETILSGIDSFLYALGLTEGYIRKFTNRKLTKVTPLVSQTLCSTPNVEISHSKIEITDKSSCDLNNNSSMKNELSSSMTSIINTDILNMKEERKYETAEIQNTIYNTKYYKDSSYEKFDPILPKKSKSDSINSKSIATPQYPNNNSILKPRNQTKTFEINQRSSQIVSTLHQNSRQISLLNTRNFQHSIDPPDEKISVSVMESIDQSDEKNAALNIKQSSDATISNYEMQRDNLSSDTVQIEEYFLKAEDLRYSDNSSKQESEIKSPTIINTQWTLTKINFYNDRSRIYEIMKPTNIENFKDDSQIVENVFAVLPNGVTICYFPSTEEK